MDIPLYEYEYDLTNFKGSFVFLENINIPQPQDFSLTRLNNQNKHSKFAVGERTALVIFVASTTS